MGGASPPPPMPATVPSESSKSRDDDGFDSSQIVKVKAWLISQFDAAGKDLPDFEYTPQSIALLHNIATLSQARTKAASIITNDFRQKALEYHSQVARLREVMEDVGLVQESLPANVVSSAVCTSSCQCGSEY